MNAFRSALGLSANGPGRSTQERVDASFLPDRGLGTVARHDTRLIREFGNTHQGILHGSRIAQWQVSTPDRASEQEIARNTEAVSNEGDVARGMPWHVPDGKRKSSQREHVSIGELLDGTGGRLHLQSPTCRTDRCGTVEW